MVMLKRIDEPYNSPTFSLEALLAIGRGGETQAQYGAISASETNNRI